MERNNYSAMRDAITLPLKFLFPSIVLTGSASAVYLTFDDGPHPVATPAILDCLRAAGAKATFFLLGRNVERYPEIARRIVAEGHRIGNHGFDHTSLLFRPAAYIADQLKRAEETIVNVTGVRPQFFRPPYGWFGPTLHSFLKSTTYTLALWDIDSRDFGTSSSDKIVRRVSRKLRPGSIVLFHDNDRTQHRIRDILPGFIDAARAARLPMHALPS